MARDEQHRCTKTYIYNVSELDLIPITNAIGEYQPKYVDNDMKIVHADHGENERVVIHVRYGMANGNDPFAVSRVIKRATDDYSYLGFENYIHDDELCPNPKCAK